MTAALRTRPIAAPAGAIAPGLLWHHGCHCPSCGQRQWAVGRRTAECTVCLSPLIIATAQPLNDEEGIAPWSNA